MKAKPKQTTLKQAYTQKDIIKIKNLGKNELLLNAA